MNESESRRPWLFFFAKRRPPIHVRAEIDIGYNISDQSVEILEIRPEWNNPNIIHQYPFTDGMGLNNREAREMVEAFFGEISAQLESGGEVKLSGFGTFNLRDKPERPGRNPKTGEEIAVTARRVVTFHASAALKEAVEANMVDALKKAAA